MNIKIIIAFLIGWILGMGIINANAEVCTESSQSYNYQSGKILEYSKKHTFKLFHSREEAQNYANEMGVPENVLKEQGKEEYRVFLTMPKNGCILMTEQN